MQPWERIAEATAPDGTSIALRRRAREYVLVAGGRDLMSSEDGPSAGALGTLGCAFLCRGGAASRILVGGLGMGFTLRAVLDASGSGARVDVAELVPEIVDWNRAWLGGLAAHPLRDRRVTVRVADVRALVRREAGVYDAVLLDVDNGPGALAHPANDALYGTRGLAELWTALRPGGVLGLWSFADDRRFTARLRRQGFAVEQHRVPGSRRGRGKWHVVWTARRPVPAGRVRAGPTSRGRRTVSRAAGSRTRTDATARERR